MSTAVSFRLCSLTACKISIDLRLFQIDDSNSGSPETHILIFEILHRWIGSQLLANQCFQNTMACAMKYPDPRSIELHSIIKEICYSLKCFVCPHSPHVNFVFEI